MDIPKNTFQDYKVLVNGGSTGISRSTCKMFKKLGAKVTATTRNLHKYKKITGITFLQCNIKNVKQIYELLEDVGQVDIIICNGGNFTGGRVSNFSPKNITDSINAAGGGYISLINKYCELHPNSKTIICANVGNWVLLNDNTGLKPIKEDIGRCYYSVGKTLLYKYIKAFPTENGSSYHRITLGYIATENVKTNYAKNAKYIGENSLVSQLKKENSDIVKNGMNKRIAARAYIEFCLLALNNENDVGYYVKNPNNYS